MMYSFTSNSVVVCSCEISFYSSLSLLVVCPLYPFHERVLSHACASHARIAPEYHFIHQAPMRMSHNEQRP